MLSCFVPLGRSFVISKSQLSHLENSDYDMHGGVIVGLQLWECETQSLFLYYYWWIIVLFYIWTTVNVLWPQIVYLKQSIVGRLGELYRKHLTQLVLLLRPIQLTASAFLKKIFIYLFFSKRGREGEREGEKHQCIHWLLLARPQPRTWPAAQACALTGSRRLMLNSLNHSSQGYICF